MHISISHQLNRVEYNARKTCNNAIRTKSNKNKGRGDYVRLHNNANMKNTITNTKHASNSNLPELNPYVRLHCYLLFAYEA